MALENITVDTLNINENGDNLENSNQSQAPCYTFVMANGIAIRSTLNPNAKEFYPSYMKKTTIQDDDQAEAAVDNNIVDKEKLEMILTPKVNTSNVDNVLQELEDEGDMKEVMVKKSKSILKSIKNLSDKKKSKSAQYMHCSLPSPLRFLRKIQEITREPKKVCFKESLDYINIKPLEKQDCSGNIQNISDKPPTNSNLIEEISTIPIEEMHEKVENIGDHKYESDSKVPDQINYLNENQTALLKPCLTQSILDNLTPPNSPRHDSCMNAYENISNVTSEKDALNVCKNSKATSNIMKSTLAGKNDSLPNNKKSVMDKFSVNILKGTTKESNCKGQNSRLVTADSTKMKPLTDLKTRTPNMVNTTKKSPPQSNISAETKSKLYANKIFTSTSKNTTTTLPKEKIISKTSADSKSILNNKSPINNSKPCGIPPILKSKETASNAKHTSFPIKTHKKETQ